MDFGINCGACPLKAFIWNIYCCNMVQEPIARHIFLSNSQLIVVSFIPVFLHSPPSQEILFSNSSFVLTKKVLEILKYWLRQRTFSNIRLWGFGLSSYLCIFNFLLLVLCILVLWYFCILYSLLQILLRHLHVFL